MSSCAMSRRWKECIQTFFLPLLVQHGTKGKCPSFCCKNLYVIFVNSSSMLMSVFNSTVQSVPYELSNIWQVRKCRHLNDAWRFRECLFCCVAGCVEVYLVWLQSENVQNETSHGTDLRIWLWCTFIRRWRRFSMEWSDTDTDSDTDGIADTKCRQWTDSTHCGPAVPVVHRFTGCPSAL